MSNSLLPVFDRNPFPIIAILAELYGVEVRSLTQGVKRNIDRFPEDFMFQLTTQEIDSLRSQNVILNTGKRGHNIKYLPWIPYLGKS